MDPSSSTSSSSSRPWFGHGKYYSAVWIIWSLSLLVFNNTVHVSSAFQMSDWSDKIFGARPTPTATTTQGSVFLASTPRHFPSSSFTSSSSSSLSSLFPSARNSFWPQSPINSMNAFQLPSSSSSSSSSSFQSSSPSTSTLFNMASNHNGFQRHHYSSRFPPLMPAPFMKSRIPMHHFLTNFQQPQPTVIRTTPAPAFDWVRELIQNRLLESRNNLNQVQESLEKIQPLVATTPAPAIAPPLIPITTTSTTTTSTTTRRPFKLGQYQVVMDHVPPPSPANPDPESMIQDHIERLDQNNNSNNNNLNNNDNRIDVDYADQIPEVKDENLDYYDPDLNSNSNNKKDPSPPTINSKQPGQGLETKIQEQKTVAKRLDERSNNQSWIQDSFAQLAKQIEHEMDRSKMKEEQQEQQERQQMEQMEQANNRLDRLIVDEERNRQKKSLDRRRRPHNRLEFEHPYLQSLDMDVNVNVDLAEQDVDDFNSINHNSNLNSNSTWSFRCPDNRTGFYADLSDDCQSYYHCSGHRRERFRFTCPYGTKFNERSSNCDWEDNVDCHQKFDLLRA